MGLLRLVTVIAVIWLVWFVVKRFQQNMLERKSAPIKKDKSVSNVKKCAVCDVHVLESETIESAGEYFCCDAHRKAYKSD